MADETTPTQPAQPAPFNADALQGYVREAAQAAVSEHVQRQQQQAVQQQVQQQRQQAAQDPIYTGVVKPWVEPGLRQANLTAEAAIDTARFYQKHPEAVEHMNDIEARFDRLRASGMPFDHETVYNHYRGEHFDQFMQKRQDELQRTAAAGATVGAPGVGRPTIQPFDPEAFRKLSLEEMGQRLKESGLTA